MTPIQFPYALRIGACIVVVGAFFALTLWPEEQDEHGHVLMLPAFPEGTEEQRATALRLGYADRGGDSAEAQMTRAHDLIHTFLCVRLDGLPYSPTLHAAARGEDYPAGPAEETRVLAFQGLMNGAAEVVPLVWDGLVEEAKAILRL